MQIMGRGTRDARAGRSGRTRRGLTLGVAIAVLFTATVLVDATPEPASALPGRAGLHPITPARILDTRDGTGGPLAKFGPATTRDLTVTGVGGVPGTGVSGVVLNVTAVLPDHASHLTVWPAGVAKPVASNLNYGPGDIAPNLVTVKVGANGKVSIFNNEGSVDILADVVGWFDDGDGAGDRFVGVTPARVLDTRNGTGGPATKFGPATTRTLDVTGVGGVPASGVTAVVLNVTAVNGSATSHVTVWPADVAKPDASNLNFFAGQVRPNLVVVKTSATGDVKLFNNSGFVDLLADVVGWFAPAGTPGIDGGGFQPIAPARIFDTRDGTGGAVAPLAPGATRRIDVTGVGGVPPYGVRAVVLNVTAVNGNAESFLTLWPSDVSRPLASNLNFKAGQVIPNLVMVKVSADGTVDLFNNSGSVDVIADVVGWYGGSTSSSPGAAPAATPLDPSVPVDFASSTAFLYSGANKIQFGVTPGAIDAPRSTVVRGKVTDPAGAPLGGVVVDAPQHQELGYTVTRADGRYDIVINGGASTLFRYTQPGRIEVQRWVPAPAGQYAVADDVAMVAESATATVVTDGSPSIQVARGDAVADDRGARRSTLLVPPSEDAKLVLADGSIQDLSSVTIHATEFTVGSLGHNAMPAELPTNTGYTYAVEFSADEAAAVGARTVTFSKPLIHYLENFLGFPVGTPIPNGYYDRSSGQWQAVPGGTVIRLTAITAGKADVDVDGDGIADTGTALTDLGIDDTERTTLAGLYAAGAQLWRVPIPHFSPYDHNPILVCTAQCEPPATVVPPPKKPDPPKNPCDKRGSIINCTMQSLGEEIPIAGTTDALAYESANAAGYTDPNHLDIVATPAVLPAEIAEVDVLVDILGRRFQFPVAVAPNQHVQFTWDGQDAYGRYVYASTPADITVRYRYNGFWARAERDDFGQPIPGVPDILAPAPKAVERTTRSTAIVGNHRPPGADIAGWSFDQHHVYQQGRLFLGSGRSIPIGAPGGIVHNTGLNALGVIATRDGSAVYNTTSRLFRRTPAGVVTTIAGTGTQCSQATPCGENVPATSISVRPRGDLAEGPDGSIFFVEGVGCVGFLCQGSVVRRIDPSGIIRTVAGNGLSCTDPATCGNNVAATSIPVHPASLAVDGGGVLWIVEDFTSLNRIRAVGLDGRITTQYGCLTDGCKFLAASPDGTHAAGAVFTAASIGVAPDGSLIVLDSVHDKVLQIDSLGVLHVVAGTTSCGGTECGIFGPAATYRFTFALEMTVGADGTIYVLDAYGTGFQILRFKIGGDIERIAGQPVICDHLFNCGTDIPALNARFEQGALAVTRDGTLYTIGESPAQLRIISPPPLSPDGLLPIPSPDGEEVYLFGTDGLHRRTVDARTGDTVRSFSYTNRRLTAMADRDGNTTVIERSPDGTPTGIMSPFGLHTSLTVDGNGNLASVVAPGNLTVALTTSPAGLLTGLTEPGGSGPHAFTYGPTGLLTSDTDPTGAATTLAKSAITGGYRVTMTSGQGRTTTIDVQVGIDGTQTTTTTDPRGAVVTNVRQPDGSATITDPTGVTVTERATLDDRFGFVQPSLSKRIETYPGGLVRTIDVSRTVTMNVADVLHPSSVTATVSVNGKATTSTYTAATRTRTVVAPAGTTSTYTYDGEGHVASWTPAGGVPPFTFSYRADGLLVGVAQGATVTTYEYDAKGRMTGVVDATGVRNDVTYDSASRLVSTASPDPARPYTFGYDPAGDLVSVHAPTTPGGTLGADYTMAYDGAGRRTGFTIPGSPAATSTWSLDGDLAGATAATGSTATRSFDAGGRWTGRTETGDTTTVAYGDSTTRMGNATRTRGADSASVSWAYQGPFPITTTFAGAASGTAHATWDTDLRLASLSLDGFPGTETFTYDAEGAVITDGPLTFTRGGPDRRVSAIGDGTGTIALGYDPSGRLVNRTLTLAGPAYAEALTRDTVGRITSSAVTLPGGTTTESYSYDSRGRLASTTRGAGPATTYTYDHHNNLVTTAAGTASFDGVDRIVTVGVVPYSYDAAGALIARGADTFTRASNGDLTAATVGGVNVTYVYDAMQRRVARTEGGVTTEYLYADPRFPMRVTHSKVGAEITQYLYEGPHLVALVRNGTRFLVATDRVGSPRVIRNPAGTTVKTVDYDPWGNVLSDSDPTFAIAVGYAGGIPDRRTGWVRFGLRDYDPATGRFTSVDPTDFDGSLNLYAYAEDDPVNHVDPTGTYSISGGFFAGPGGEFELSWGADGWTICVTAGFGIGASVGADPLSRNSNPGGSGVVGNISLGNFAAEIGTTASSFTDDCGKKTFQATLDARAGPIQSHLGAKTDLQTGSKVIADLGYADSFEPEIPIKAPGGGKVGLQAKAGYKKCRHWDG